MAKKKWSDLTSGQRQAMIALGVVEVALAGAAYVDLLRRPADQVDGSKGTWAAIIAINIVGPIAYFTRGRKAPLGA
jgi:hypothetical protein